MKGRAAIPKSRVAYIAPTYQQARDIAWTQLREDCREAAQAINESRLEITLVNGSTIVLRGWESIETLRGQMFDMVVLDEVAMMRNFWEMWQEVIRPTLTDTKGEGLFISTPKGFNHFYDLYNFERTDDNYKSFHFTSYDNPHVPKEEIDTAKREVTDDRFHQEYMADFRKMEGLVYKDFFREAHTFKEKKVDTVERILGIDFGWTNPTAIMFIEKGHDGVYYIMDEWVHSNKTTREIVEVAKGWNPHVVYADPAEPDRIEELKKEGLYCMEVSKEIPPRIVAISQLFRLGRLKIHEDCIHLITELETYHYPDKKPDKDEPEKPVHEDCDAINAMEYALYMNAGMSGRVSVPRGELQTAEFKAMIKRKKELGKNKTLFV